MVAKFPQEGKKVRKHEAGKIDYSHINDGYVIAWVYDKDPHRKFKIRVEVGDKLQHFSAHPEHGEVYIPLTYGSGTYTIRVLRNTNTTGVSYLPMIAVTQEVKLVSELSPWLYPSCYAEYFKDSECVGIAQQLMDGCKSDMERLGLITAWIMDYLEYDYELAKVVDEDQTKFWIPTPDEVIKKKVGICWEYASLAAALFRVSGIPCKIVVGWVNGVYHAWNEIWLEDGGSLVDGYPVPEKQWVILDLTYADGSGSIKAFYDFAANNVYNPEYFG